MNPGIPRLTVATGIACLLTMVGAAVSEARTLTCESVDHRTQYCRADTRGGVRLIQQFSKSSCFAGETWGYDRWGIWVTAGCRARFAVSDYSGAPYRGRDQDDGYRSGDGRRHWRTPRTIKCESWRDRLNYCRAPLGDARVTIEQQLSDTRCRLGENWGWDGGGIWVKKGCRAIFSIY